MNGKETQKISLWSLNSDCEQVDEIGKKTHTNQKSI